MSTPDERRDPGDRRDLEESAADSPRKRRVSTAGAVIALLVGLLAFALVVQVQSNVGDTQLENARQDDLVRILSDLNAREERLRADTANLERTLSNLGAGAQGREAALAEARRRADALGILAGTLAAEGEGLIVGVQPKGAATRAATVLEAVQELRAPESRRCRSRVSQVRRCALSPRRSSPMAQAGWWSTDRRCRRRTP